MLASALHGTQVLLPVRQTSCIHGFRRVSGLRLNVHKCVLAPLFIQGVADIWARLSTLAPSWGSFTNADKAKYLGYYVGPGKAARQWGDIEEKILKRLASWSWGALGLHLATVVYNVFITSIIT